ncbi:hypothetical protein PO909_006562 [Leuciscus waleckii]
MEPATDGAPSPLQALPSQLASISLSVPERATQGWRKELGAPGRGPGGVLCLCMCPPLAPKKRGASGTHIFKERAISSVPWSQEGQTGGARPCAKPCTLQPPLVSPAGSWVRFEDLVTPSHAFRAGVPATSGPPGLVHRNLESAPNLSSWLLRTNRLGYTIQFVWRPPKFSVIRYTPVLSECAVVMHSVIAVLLAKDAIEPFPPDDMKTGFDSPSSKTHF